MRKFCSAPRTIGSIAPSSPYLAEAMLGKVNWNSADNIAELGAGTGVFTKKIITSMRPGARFMAFEIIEELREKLIKEFGPYVYPDARALPEIMRKTGAGKLDLVVSSLPYAVLPNEVTNSVLCAIISSMEPDGEFIAFQYSLHMKESFKKIFKSVEISFVPVNIPPAFVYKCRGITKA